MKSWLRLVVTPLLVLTLACATSPLGRKQFTLLPDSQMNEMGIAAFAEMKGQVPISVDSRINEYVTCVAEHIVAECTDDTGVDQWEIVVFVDDTPNAFALPGGKIGVHTGLLTVAETPDQLAAVIGHEVAHVIARHGNERVSTAFATQMSLQVIDSILKDPESEDHGMLMGLLGLGAQLGIMLPYSRAHEREADLIGQDLMAKAGFLPDAAIQLWYNMLAAAGEGPPEFLSTHPSGENRIAELENRLPSAMQIYLDARESGRRPSCPPPR